MIVFTNVNIELPHENSKVLVMAVNKNYQFGHPQLLAGHFIKVYYDTPINDFKLTGIDDKSWVVISWSHYDLKYNE